MGSIWSVVKDRREPLEEGQKNVAYHRNHLIAALKQQLCQVEQQREEVDKTVAATLALRPKMLNNDKSR